MHTRSRHIEQILSKRARIFPVLGVLGPRQVGKSTFLMGQWKSLQSATYITLDRREYALRAKNSPEQLILSESDNQRKHLIIDEAQKVPHLFDSLKAIIDENRRIGKFTLSGSVDFSLRAGVRESLAGRMGLTRLYPMTLRELHELKYSDPWIKFRFKGGCAPLPPNAVETWLERGGMPVFCKLSDINERTILIKSWIEAICYRDIKQLKDAKYDSDLAYNLLINLAADPNISISRFADGEGVTSQSVKKHLAALESLFLLYSIPSIENPRAQSSYKIFDSAVLRALLGNRQDNYVRHSCLLTLVINEIYSQYEYSGSIKPELYYYRTRGGAEIDLVLKTKDKIIGIECIDSVEISNYAQRGMKSFLKKYNKAEGYFIAPVTEPYKLGKRMCVIPWNSIG